LEKNPVGKTMIKEDGFISLIEIAELAVYDLNKQEVKNGNT